MRRFRFSIASLLGVVVIVAVAFAALREATDTWDSGLFSVTLLGLLTAVLMAIHRKERERAFWLGFALFGWAFLIAVLIPPVESRLPTAKGLAYLDSKLSDRVIAVTWGLTTPGGVTSTGNAVQALAFSPDGKTFDTKGQATVRLWNVTTGRLFATSSGTSENFVKIGHSLMALVMAFLGGRLSRRLYVTSRSDTPSQSIGSSVQTNSGG